MRLRKLVIIGTMAVLLTSCSLLEPESEDISISFIVKNSLLWHIGHDYKVSGTNDKGKNFESKELEIRYSGILLEGQGIKMGSKVTLYRDGGVFWTSKKLNKSCQIIYTDSAFQDKVEYN